jgi:hypothetical protein
VIPNTVKIVPNHHIRYQIAYVIPNTVKIVPNHHIRYQTNTFKPQIQ